LLDVSDQTFSRISADKYIDRDMYIEYVFHHEVYHCLKSMYLGPQPMSFKKYWSSYSIHRDEQGADAFALAMLIKARKGIDQQIKNLARVRRLSFLNADLEHWTGFAIDRVLNTEPKEILSRDVHRIFDYANQIRAARFPHYEDFLPFQAAGVVVMDKMGLQNYITEEQWQSLDQIEVNDTLVEELLHDNETVYRELLAQEPPWIRQ
ncbi:hypothetical protein, partial [Kaarinaea lacus]